jgi:hypothetical protein
MADSQSRRLHVHDSAFYHIRVEGHLDECWADYCGGLTIRAEGEAGASPVTVLTGKVLDQAALFGVLNFLYDNRLPLLSVEWVAEET